VLASTEKEKTMGHWFGMCAGIVVGGLVVLAGASIVHGEEAGGPAAAMEPIAPGPFKPDWESLKQYQCPEWFRDAKFGIWAHWSAQCVPENGDWYARGMYEQGSGHYKYHVEHYGHPSKVGFKDICSLWKAEKWEPDKLIALYKRAGAKYFVALANHHCNFDCWDSKYQPWNSVNIGPKKDIVGIWAKAARSQGLRFGVTVHAARSWDWYDVAHGSDKEGQLKGVPYDGALTKADGKGQWWEGYDPADLYGPHGAARTPEARQAYNEKFFLRVKDLVDSYRPDLLYFDDGRMPISDGVGLRIAAHYYNASAQWHQGRVEAVLNTKGMPADLLKCLVHDFERGRADRLQDFPWQTDTCIGEWHYHRGIRYASARDVITQLVDIVSKNGNMLLNIPVKGDGTIDDAEVKLLEEMAKWIAVNGEGIFGTRPWKIFGEGPRRAGGRARGVSAQDIRFTTKGDSLYAFAFGWPESGKLTIRSLAKPAAGEAGNKIASVSLLGHEGKVEFSQSEEGLTITLPAQKPCDHAVAFKIAGEDFKPVEVKVAAQGIRPAADGSVTLDADSADLHGSQVQVESRGGQQNVGYWDDPNDWLSWPVQFPQAGAYQVTASYAAAAGDSELALEAPGQELVGKAARTDSWDSFRPLSFGKLEVKQAGDCVIKLRPRDAKTWKPINLRSVKLTKAE
jgi:alpha-L-fucosidase